MKLSLPAQELIRNTIDHTKEQESSGLHPVFTSQFWVDVLKNPNQYKKLIKDVEKQAAANLIQKVGNVALRR